MPRLFCEILSWGLDDKKQVHVSVKVVFEVNFCCLTTRSKYPDNLKSAYDGDL